MASSRLARRHGLPRPCRDLRGDAAARGLRGLVDASTEEILAAAIAQGMRTLRQDGNRLCLAGTTSLDEVARVAGDLID